MSDEPPIASDQDVSVDAERRLSFGSVAGQYDRHRRARDRPDHLGLRERVRGARGTLAPFWNRPARERLFAGITGAIDAVGGSFELTYVTLLGLARRTDG